MRRSRGAVSIGCASFISPSDPLPEEIEAYRAVSVGYVSMNIIEINVITSIAHIPKPPIFATRN
jgi:hypothetical protein